LFFVVVFSFTIGLVKYIYMANNNIMSAEDMLATVV